MRLRWWYKFWMTVWVNLLQAWLFSRLWYRNQFRYSDTIIWMQVAHMFDFKIWDTFTNVFSPCSTKSWQPVFKWARMLFAKIVIILLMHLQTCSLFMIEYNQYTFIRASTDYEYHNTCMLASAMPDNDSHCSTIPDRCLHHQLLNGLSEIRAQTANADMQHVLIYSIHVK